MKQSLSIIILVILSFLVGCSPQAAPTATPMPSPTPAAPKVALVMKTLSNPFFVAMERGARRAASELGVDLIVKTATQETSIEQQIDIIEEMIEQQVDAIVIAPGDSQAVIPVLKKAQDAGIVIVNIDNQLDPVTSQEQGLVNVPFVSVDNVQGAYLAAKTISDTITTPTEAAVLEGIRTAQNAQDRKDGAVKAFEENDNITVVASETANWKIDEAYTVTQSLFENNPNIKIIFAANDMMALGAIQYLTETGKTDVIVGGYDALDEALAAIKEGKLMVTVDQQADLQGYMGIDLAIKAMNSETLAPITLVDVKVVTAENVE